MLFIAFHPFYLSPSQTTSPSALHSSDDVSGDKWRRLREFGFDERPRLSGKGGNGRNVLYAGKRRVLFLSLEVSRIEVQVLPHRLNWLLKPHAASSRDKIFTSHKSLKPGLTLI